MKTYEQFVLEEKNLEQQDLYPDLTHEDVGSSKGCGPMETKTTSADNKGCSNPATYTVTTSLSGDYFLANEDGKMLIPHRVDSGKVKDQDFSAIQKRIDYFKSGKVRVYKGDWRSSFERTEECIKYEAYFETNLENAIKELKKHPHYGSAHWNYSFTRP